LCDGLVIPATYKPIKRSVGGVLLPVNLPKLILARSDMKDEQLRQGQRRVADAYITSDIQVVFSIPPPDIDGLRQLILSAGLAAKDSVQAMLLSAELALAKKAYIEDLARFLSYVLRP